MPRTPEMDDFLYWIKRYLCGPLDEKTDVGYFDKHDRQNFDEFWSLLRPRLEKWAWAAGVNNRAVARRKAKTFYTSRVGKKGWETVSQLVCLCVPL